MDLSQQLSYPISPSALADIVLVVMLVEPFALASYRRLTGRGPRIIEALAIILPGLILMLVLKAALAGAPVPAIAGLLFAALLSHLGDLWSRFG